MIHLEVQNKKYALLFKVSCLYLDFRNNFQVSVVLISLFVSFRSSKFSSIKAVHNLNSTLAEFLFPLLRYNLGSPLVLHQLAT